MAGPAPGTSGQPAPPPKGQPGSAPVAVGPEPQYAPTGTPGPAPSEANRSRNSARPRKRPSPVTLPAAGALTAPGMCPATGSTGSVSPRYRSAALASSSTPERAVADAP